MKIVVDKNITGGVEAFSFHGDVIEAEGRKITPDILKDCDALIVRSVTNVNEQLLKGTNVKFVATATIGTDHLDKNYLQETGIRYNSAPGCNSTAVAEYVLNVVTRAICERQEKFEGKTASVIGVGNIGKKVARIFEILGFEVKLNDPPRERTEGKTGFVSLEEALTSDIITFHTPMIKTGEFKTFHLLNEENISLVKPDVILVNASRGAVTDNKTLLKFLNNNPGAFSVLDVWENEPDISLPLLKKVNTGTPHIAGYSLEGKINGTYACYKNFCEYFGFKEMWKPVLAEVKDNIIDLAGLSFEKSLLRLADRVYDISKDDYDLRNGCTNEKNEFDLLRKNYNVRREIKNYTLINGNEKTERLKEYLNSI